MCSNVERGERVALFMPRLQIEHMWAELLRTCRGRISKNMQQQLWIPPQLMMSIVQHVAFALHGQLQRTQFLCRSRPARI